jgi:hypothetical protein
VHAQPACIVDVVTSTRTAGGTCIATNSCCTSMCMCVYMYMCVCVHDAVQAHIGAARRLDVSASVVLLAAEAVRRVQDMSPRVMCLF